MATLRADSQAAADAQAAAAKASVPTVAKTVSSLSSLGVNPTVKTTATPTSTIPSFSPTTAIVGGPNLSGEVPAGTISSGAYAPTPTPTPTPTPSGDPNDDPAYKILRNLLDTYDIKGVADTLAKIRLDYPKISSDNMMDLLRYDTRYNGSYLERFSGNKLRMENKLPMLDEKTYLNQEQGYGKVFNSYDLGSYANRSQYATLIGNDVSVTEATNRVSLAYDRVVHSDPGTLQAFKNFYPSLSTGDIVGAMLNPKEGYQTLTRKVQSAEIGGSALNAGLLADQTRDMQLADYGITKEMAQTGYKTIADVLPTASKLSSVYGETPYTQTTGEQEAFNLAGGTEAAKARKKLTGLETASFSGSSGTAKGSFSTGYLSKQNSAGQY